MGGAARGTYVITQQRQDLSEEEFFQAVLGSDVPFLHTQVRQRP